MNIIIESENAEEYSVLCKECVAAVFKKLSLDFDAEVSLSLVSEAEIRAINLEHRGIDAVTDVLSFPLGTPEHGASAANVTCGDIALFNGICAEDFDVSPENGCRCLGDIVVCTDRAAAQAREYGHSLRRENAFLLVHSILHLLGFDHVTAEQEAVMFPLTEEILLEMGTPATGIARECEK